MLDKEESEIERHIWEATGLEVVGPEKETKSYKSKYTIENEIKKRSYDCCVACKRRGFSATEKSCYGKCVNHFKEE